MIQNTFIYENYFLSHSTQKKEIFYKTRAFLDSNNKQYFILIESAMFKMFIHLSIHVFLSIIYIYIIWQIVYNDFYD